MADFEDIIKQAILTAIKGIVSVDKNVDINQEEIDSLEINLEIPPDQNMGDFAFPCFSLSKLLKKNPAEIANELKSFIEKNIISDEKSDLEKIEVKGPYLNFFVNKSIFNENILKNISTQKQCYGSFSEKNDTVLVESPGPNTNKPLHLGHLRNILLGTSITNILRYYGKKVHTVNVVNDRGIHICKSMLAYQKFGNNVTPQSENKKSDHFVGDYYVKYSQAEKENPELENEAQALLLKWEENDKETIDLWKMMNKWALDGFQVTYDKLGLKIEKEYLESDTYKHGKDIILKALDEGKFEKDDEGAILLNLEDKKLGKKVLLRANGTTVYITQDIYMAKKRNEDFKFDEMIYVVGNEQNYHFQVLFEVFKKLEWKFADNCYHFSYGMVELPEGKMKSREGNVIDTDDLIENVKNIAKEEVKKRYNDLDDAEIDKRSEAISMAAIRFFFLKFDPIKNFVFDIKESLSFDGETGPYLQYAHARICSILRKHFDDDNITANDASEKVFSLQEGLDLSILGSDEEKKLIKKLDEFSSVIEDSATHLKPSTLCRYLLDIAQLFNEFYHNNQVLKAESEELKNARLLLSACTRQVLENGLNLLNIIPLERM